jgi:hypothetical protein
MIKLFLRIIPPYKDLLENGDTVSLTSALNGGKWSALSFGRFTRHSYTDVDTAVIKRRILSVPRIKPHFIYL